MSIQAGTHGASSGASQAFRLLLLEDDDEDARHIQQVLEAWQPISITRTTTRDQFIDALERMVFDVALIENDVPGLAGRAALGMVRDTHPEVPVIMVTRPLGEPAAVELLKAGARDYVLKGDLGHLAIAVQRAVSVEDGIRDRKAREHETRRSELRYRRLFESARDGILLLDAESGHITDANPFICSLLDETRTGLVGKQLWEIGVVADIDASKQMVRQLQETGYVRYDNLPLRTSTDVAREVEFISNSYAEADETVIQCNIRDVSAHRRLERAAAENDRRLRSMLDDIDLVAVQLDLDGHVTYANDYFLSLVGFRRNEVIGADWFEAFVPSEDRNETRRVMADLLTDDETARRHHENEILTKSGERRLIRWSNTALRDEAGNTVGSAAVGEDLTEFRLISRRFLALMENTSDIAGILDTTGQVSVISNAVSTLGFTPAEVIGTRFTDWVHPDDLDIAARSFTSLLEGPDAKAHFELRARHKDGSWLDMDVVAINRSHVPGIDGIAVFLRDMTEGKRTRSELHASQQLLAGIVDSLPVRVFWKDTDLVYLGCNTAFAEDAGFTDPSEVIGKSDDAMGWHDQVELYTADDREVMDSGQAKLLIEEPQTTPTGDTITLLTSKVPLRSETGEVVGILGTYLDITMRARQQEVIERSLGATVAALSHTVELRDLYTAGHQRRVADLAAHIAESLGLSADRIRGLKMAASIHDLGKISIPSEILSKPGQLTDVELTLVQQHAEAGYQLVRDLEFPWPVADMIRQHHERLDGSGYPQGLTDDDILLEAKIIAVADIVEAVTTHRPYRPALGVAAALDIIVEGRGTTLDADAVDACVTLFRDERYTFPDR